MGNNDTQDSRKQHTAHTHRTRAKAAALDGVAERLATQFPELSGEQIASAIHGHYDGFDASPIRDFIPVLVERAVSADLTQPDAASTPRHRA